MTTNAVLFYAKLKNEEKKLVNRKKFRAKECRILHIENLTGNKKSQV